MLSLFKPTTSKYLFLKFATFSIALTTCISLLAGVLVTPRAPTVHLVTVPLRPGDLPIVRAAEVQDNAPPWPVSRSGDEANAKWVVVPRPIPYGTGRYLKIRDSSTIQWDEIEFNEINPYGNGGINWNSPLLIDLGWDGFNLGEPGTGVHFDLLADGNDIHTQWVAIDTNDAFLGIDLNFNGIVDNGSELFGEGTSIHNHNRKAQNGYEALAQYDMQENGGNEDGFITKHDKVWRSLILWFDIDADGKSRPSEIKSFRNYSITKIDLAAKKTTNRFDKAGNWIPYWSWVKTRQKGSPKRIKMADVYFLQLDE